MKKTFFSIVVLFCVMLASQAAELIVNGSFKEMEGPSLKGWNLGKGASRVMDEDDGTPLIHLGKDSYGALTQQISLPAGKPYTIRIRARRTGATGQLGILFITAPYKGSTEHNIAWNLLLDTDYVEYACPFISRKTTRLGLYRLDKQGGEIEIASVSLTEGFPVEENVKLSDGRQVKNLLKNPCFFNVKDRRLMDWQVRKNVIWRGGRVIAGSGSYAALDQDVTLVAGKEYTVVVRARRIGAEPKLGVLPLLFTAGNKLKELPSIAWNKELTEQFQDYAFTFKAPGNKIRLNFYRIKMASAGSIEFEKIILFEGK